mmetsp:Transcript_38706/g.87236  ORF Transcript_38706/g.87236 Transcript_38706/m.87236 type:complete len:406 (-) Transcript_38706:41-1258(-)
MHPMQDDNDGSSMRFRRSSQASARAANERMIAYPLPRNSHTVRFESMPTSEKKDLQGDLEVKHPNLQIQVDCFLPASTGATVSNPITPSPQPFRAAQSSRSSSSGVVKIDGCSSNENPFQQSQKRVGYDGTSQTPSLQLLKPTASSIGHRRSNNNTSQESPPPRTHWANPGPARESNLNTISNMATSRLAQMSFENTPKSPLEPFECLNLKGSSTFDDNLTNNTDSSNNLDEYFEDDPSIRPQRKFQRSSTWSPGFDPSPFDSGGGRGRGNPPDTLRSDLLDPVASQLWDEDARLKLDPLCLSSRAVPSFRSSSTGALASSCPTNPMFTTRSDSPRVRTNAESPTLPPPASPNPLFREVSSSLLDVKSTDDLNRLARPVAMKCQKRLSIPPRRLSTPDRATTYKA